MSIKETKLFKGSVETPKLVTDEIEYLGYELPLYDKISAQFVSEPKLYKKDFGTSTSSTTGVYDCIRFLPYSSVLQQNKIVTLKNLSLYLAGAGSSNWTNWFVVCAYTLVGGNYTFVGHSKNAFAISSHASLAKFNFDLELCNKVTLMPYKQIFFKFYSVQVNANGELITNVGQPQWLSPNFTTLNLIGTRSNDLVNYDPHFVVLSEDITPKATIEYSTGNYITNQRIPHNLNGDVHLSKEYKDKIDTICELSDKMFVTNDEIVNKTIVDTNDTGISSGSDKLCCIIINPEKYIGKFLKAFLLRLHEGAVRDKYLQADCYDAGGSLVETYFSISHPTQTNLDAIFYFDGFQMKENFHKIKFKLSNQNTSRQENYLTFFGKTFTSKTSGQYTYAKGWQIEWLQGAPDSGGEDLIRNPNDRTPNVLIRFDDNLVVGENITKHMMSSKLHLVEDEREILDAVKRVINHESVVTTYNVKVLANAPNLGNQSVTAFHIGCEDLIQKKIKSVTIIRNDHTNLLSNFFLYADCYDANNNYLKTIFTSSDAQSQNASLGFETKFEFQDLVIEKNFKKLIFKASTTYGSRQNKKFRIGCLQTSTGSNILYKDYKTEWNDGQIQNFTSYFEFGVTSSKHSFEKYNEFNP